ncbi:MAG: ABC transporter permease [Acidobacteria bacterium]|nr:ABC transporter permease [Acidobacteriota bacterium]MBI3655019.1 ABC transporter permease [Acidobacteriota bacterium]
MNAPAAAQRFPYYFEIIKNLTIRDIKVKYKRSSLGFLWTLLNPLCTAAVYIFVFSQILRAGIDNYWAFLLSGFFAWNFFSLTLFSGSDVISTNRSIVTRVFFPHEILVLSNALCKLIEYSFELVIVIPLLCIFHLHRLPASLLALPLLLLLQIMVSTAFVFPLACLRVFYKDVEQVLPIVMTAWFFLTPIVYTLDQVPKNYLGLLALNPMVGIITAYHDMLYLGRFPDPTALAHTSLISVVLLALGYWGFYRFKGIFAEII